MSYPNSRGGYSNAPVPGNPRQSEAWALTEAARRISEAKERHGAGAEFLAAIRLNWRLWTIFQAELSSAESQVPDEIRGNMLSLCNFVDKVTVDIIAEPTVDKANILITINRHIAAGLFTTPTGDASSPPSDMPPSSGLSGISA
ncbi:MAG: flagellar biosynthesis regulator FlaF [Bacteroidota bacterium]